MNLHHNSFLGKRFDEKVARKLGEQKQTPNKLVCKRWYEKENVGLRRKSRGQSKRLRNLYLRCQHANSSIHTSIHPSSPSLPLSAAAVSVSRSSTYLSWRVCVCVSRWQTNTYVGAMWLLFTGNERSQNRNTAVHSASPSSGAVILNLGPGGPQRRNLGRLGRRNRKGGIGEEARQVQIHNGRTNSAQTSP